MEDGWITAKQRKRNFREKYKTKEEEHIALDVNPFDKVEENDEKEEDHVSEPKDSELLEIESGEKLYLNSIWSVWVHRADCKSWTEDSYINIYNIESISSFWKFFNYFHLLNKYENQFFIMKNKIKPIWEDNANRNGAICSIKIDSKNNSLVSEAIISLCLLIMNETLLSNYSEIINGMSIAYKSRSILLKIWYNDRTKILTDYLPFTLIEKIENTIRTNKDDNCISIQCKQIKPEYEL